MLTLHIRAASLARRFHTFSTFAESPYSSTLAIGRHFSTALDSMSTWRDHGLAIPLVLAIVTSRVLPVVVSQRFV
jgi:hypothetical protein